MRRVLFKWSWTAENRINLGPSNALLPAQREEVPENIEAGPNSIGVRKHCAYCCPVLELTISQTQRYIAGMYRPLVRDLRELMC